MRFETIRERCDWIKTKVSMTDVFDDFSVSYQKMSLPHQVRCPFHDDIHASARFFPEQNNGSGSFFCWACDMGGDVVWLVQELYQLENSVEACRKIEEQYNLEHSGNDTVEAFYRASHILENAEDESDLIAEHLKLFEVKLVGSTYESDIDHRGFFFEIRQDEIIPEHLPTLIAFWHKFDSMVEDLGSMTYQEVGISFDEWRETLSRWISKVFSWQVAEDSD